MEKRGRGRLPGFRMDDSHRVKIQNSNVLNALIEHVEGRREMSGTQVTAGVALLKKVLPDLAHIEHANDPENPLIRSEEISDAELAAIAAAGRDGVVAPPQGTRKPH